YRLAECYEQLNRFARAWTAFTKIADAAEQQGQAKREGIARDRARAIDPKVGFFAITLPPAVYRTAELLITLDEESIDRAMWKDTSRVILAADLGTHVFAATVPGKLPWRRVIELKKTNLPVEVVIMRLVNQYTPP